MHVPGGRQHLVLWELRGCGPPELEEPLLVEGQVPLTRVPEFLLWHPCLA